MSCMAWDGKVADMNRCRLSTCNDGTFAPHNR